MSLPTYFLQFAVCSLDLSGVLKSLSTRASVKGLLTGGFMLILVVDAFQWFLVYVPCLIAVAR